MTSHYIHLNDTETLTPTTHLSYSVLAGKTTSPSRQKMTESSNISGNSQRVSKHQKTWNLGLALRYLIRLASFIRIALYLNLSLLRHLIIHSIAACLLRPINLRFSFVHTLAHSFFLFALLHFPHLSLPLR